MSTGVRVSPAEMDRLRNHAHRKRAQFIRIFMRKNSKRLILASGTIGALYLAVVAFHPFG